MFSLYYERRHNVLMTRITGVLSSQDIVDHDRALLRFLASKADVRGLYDFSKVDALAVPVSKIDQRGQRPAMIEGLRVVVAPPAAAGLDFASRIADQLRGAGHREPVIVPTIDEAHRLLGLDDPKFEPIEHGQD